jgi:hypothetical protein
MSFLSFLRASVLIVATIFISFPVAAQTDASSEGLRLSLHAQGGYTSFSMNEATDFFRAVVGAYQEQGVNIPVQQTYPGNSMLGGGVSLDAYGWSAGLHVRYARSEAAALYGDIGGTLDVTSETSAWILESSTGYTFRRTHRLQPFVEARAGTVFSRYAFEERIRLSFGEDSVESFGRIDAQGRGFSMSGIGGVRYPLGPVFLRAEAGYRHAWVGTDDDDLIFNVGYSGPVASFGVEVPVRTFR